jgi:hypothetical protein
VGGGSLLILRIVGQKSRSQLLKIEQQFDKILPYNCPLNLEFVYSKHYFPLVELPPYIQLHQTVFYTEFRSLPVRPLFYTRILLVSIELFLFVLTEFRSLLEKESENSVSKEELECKVEVLQEEAELLRKESESERNSLNEKLEESECKVEVLQEEIETLTKQIETAQLLVSIELFLFVLTEFRSLLVRPLFYTLILPV